jgi:rod shape-determining protein MreC
VAIGGRTRSTRGLVILLVTASLVIITVDYREGSNGPLSKISDGLHTVVLPLQNGVSKVFHPVATFFGALGHAFSNEQKIKRLQDQLDQARTEGAQYQIALAELTNLEKLLGVAQSYDFQTTGANVIENGVSQSEWTIGINKGSNDGLKVDMPVISSQGLVGRVVQVTPVGSEVLLVTDPNSFVATRLVVSQETGLVQGQGRADMVMSSLDQATEVTDGEPVMTSGYSGGLFPPGLPVGNVSRVEHDAATGAIEVSVSPYVDFSTLDVVLVIKSFTFSGG